MAGMEAKEEDEEEEKKEKEKEKEEEETCWRRSAPWQWPWRRLHQVENLGFPNHTRWAGASVSVWCSH